jgi:hypothetical protein
MELETFVFPVLSVFSGFIRGQNLWLYLSIWLRFLPREA